MRPTSKRTIITSKTTGRRYYLGRASNRTNSRRYYVCSKPDCDGRLTRESDFFCRTHSQSHKSDDVDEDVFNDNSEIIEEETSTEVQSSPHNVEQSSPHNVEQSSPHNVEQSSPHNDEQPNNSILGDDLNSSIVENDLNNSVPLSSRQRTKANRQVDVDESTGRRTFRDESGRLRYLCTNSTCTNMLKRQTDVFCRIHTTDTEKKQKRGNHKRHSAPPSSNTIKKRFRSPFSTTTVENGTNGNHSEEYDSPQKSPEHTETVRSFRDASGKIRFLCLNPSCNSRLIRRSDMFCKRHQADVQIKNDDNHVQLNTTNDSINHDKEDNNVQEMDVNHNNPDISSEPSIKKRKYGTQTITSKACDLSIIPANKMVISTTTLLDNQWTDVLTFLRQFPQVQLSTNLNVNHFTTHLLVDDNENLLHCTITKKIVQAAVRRHIFIISSRWINECINSNQFLAEHPYEIQSDSHTTLRLSIQNFQINNQYLFNPSYGFAIECRQCQGSINRNELIELIELTGAKFYDNDKQIDILIVLCDTNEKNLTKIKEKYLHINLTNIKYVTSDFLLKSIIKFEIQDIDKYSL